MPKRAVFLDLNGTLVLPITPDRLNQLRPIEGTSEAIAQLSEAGLICPVITVQSRIAKGYFSATEFSGWFSDFAADLARQGANVVGPYVCPHRFAEPCACKKPQGLLYQQAALEHDLDLGRSFVIGDSPEDVQAAHNFGGLGCLVRTGWAADPAVEERGRPYAASISDSIVDAANWIVRELRWDMTTPA